MVEVEGLCKCFHSIEALHDVSIKVGKGSIYGLVGSNGAGKTTLLKVLAGIYKQDYGQVHINKQTVFENMGVKMRTVFIPDHLYFFPNFTIQDMAHFYKNVYINWNHARYLKLSGVFNLEENRQIRSFSKGMQRQAAFWLGLSLEPDLMLLDEPLDGLDPVMRHKVKNLIFQDVADRAMTVIISSHNLREIEDVCDFIGILHRGKMIIQREIDDLKADIQKVQIAFRDEIPSAVLCDENILHQEQRGSVLLLIMRGSRAEILQRMQAHNPVILDILPLTLEEIFIYEMGDKGYEIQNLLY